MQQPAVSPGVPFRPGLADVFYAGAVKFAGDKGKPQSMADPTDFQGRMARARESMELALDGEGGENRAEDAYERLMSMAEENPAATIDELMKIIGRG
jgi:hypothetical protein